MSAPTNPAVAAPARRQPAMMFIMLTVLIDMVSIGLIIPVLPKLVGTFASSPAEQVSAFAIVSMAFAFANFISSPILGALSDRFGRRPVLLMGFSGLATSFFVTSVATHLWMLVAVRLFSGSMQANAAVANAYVADITEPQDRAKRYGMLGAMFGLGFILGPVLGGLLGGINLRLPFVVAGSLAVCNWLYGFFVLPESLPAERRQPFSWRKANPLGSLMHLMELKGVGALLIVIALTAQAQFIVHTTWALYTQLKFGWEPQQIGWSLFAVGMMSVLVQGGLMRLFTKWMSTQTLAVLGLVSSSLCYFGWAAATQGWMMYAMIVVNVLGFAAMSSIQSLISNAVDAQSQGRTMGAVSGLQSLTMVLAPVIGPLLLKRVAHLPHGDWRIGAPFFLCAALQAGATLMALVHFGRLRRTAPAAALT